VSLVITRRPGEAVVLRSSDGQTRRVYVVSIEGNVVRLAFDAPRESKILREELLELELEPP
jgi:carbon storage regulator CsrA